MSCRHRIGMRRASRRAWLGAALLAVCSGQFLAAACPEPTTDRGLYFPKKAYVRAPLPSFETLKSRLPAPIDDAHPLWLETYWKTWELAFRNFHEPPPGEWLRLAVA